MKNFHKGGGWSARFHTLIQKFKGSKWQIVPNVTVSHLHFTCTAPRFNFCANLCLLFQNIFWARIGCFDVYDTDKYEVHSINLVEHLNFVWLW